MSTIRTCSYCYRKSCWVLLFQCGDCRRSRYCSIVCQRDGWTQHRSVCQAIVARHKARKIARQSARRAIIFLELSAILKIQKCVRGYLQRVKFQRVISNATFIMITTERTSTLPPATEGDRIDEADCQAILERVNSFLPPAAKGEILARPSDVRRLYSRHFETKDKSLEGETKSNSTLTPAAEKERISDADLEKMLLDAFEAANRIPITAGFGATTTAEARALLSEHEEIVANFKKNGTMTRRELDRHKVIRKKINRVVVGKKGIRFKKEQRNDKCACGSNKKYKKCCMRHTAKSVTPIYQTGKIPGEKMKKFKR